MAETDGSIVRGMDLGELQRLHELVTRATEATTVEGVAKVLVDEAMAVLGIPIAGVWLLKGDTLDVVHFGGAPTGPWQKVPLAGDSPLAVCVRNGRPEWLATPEEYRARFPESRQRMTSEVACACLPLVAGGRPIGGAVFASRQSLHLSAEEKTALTLIARQCAQALERLLLIDAERFARCQAERFAQRMDALQAAAARLAAARGFDQIATIIVEEATGGIGGSASGLWRIEGDRIVLARNAGISPSVIEAIGRIPMNEPGALAEAVRTRRPQYLGSRGGAAERHRFDDVRWASIEALVAVPLMAADRLLGILGVAFSQPRHFDVGEREMIELFAGHAAQAIARDRDDRAQRVLAEASSSLAGTLDRAAVLQRVGAVSVAEFADWCFVDLVRPDGELERAVVAHADPADHELAAELRRIRVPLTSAVPSVIATQEPRIMEHVSDAEVARVQRDEEAGRLARTLRAQSVLSVPMSVGGRAIGAITWVGTGRSLDARDMSIAAQIARAAAAALENGRLYQAQADSARRLGKLYELTVALSSARTPEEVANLTTRLGCEATGAGSSFVWMRDPTGTLRAIGAHAPPHWIREWAVLSDPQLPAHRVLATGESVWVESPLDYEREAAAALDVARAAGRVNPFVALPLVIGGERRALLAMSWHEHHRFEADERTFVSAIARSCEQALERAELYTTEAGARAAAEAASSAKDEFLAMLGHELRNPLAPIVTALELMRIRGVAEGAHERAVIERQVNHLARLVDDLLDISRITRGKIELRRNRDELMRAVEPAIEAVGPLLVQHGHQLEVNVPTSGLVVDADLERISQVVRNLLTNAAKFTPSGGKIGIVARVDGTDIELVVSDNGRGIAPTLLPRVFEPFVQGTQGAERSAGGLGLGLAIVKNVVELHGGSVAITSEGAGCGTRATVRLPRAQEVADAPRASETAARAGKAMRILVVDDNVDAASLLGELVRLLGHEPVIAHDAGAALAVGSREKPTLAILDLGLPEIDGYALARKMKDDPTLARVPIVALTGYGQRSDRERSRAAGFVEHLVKPIDLQKLRAVIERFV